MKGYDFGLGGSRTFGAACVLHILCKNSPPSIVHEIAIKYELVIPVVVAESGDTQILDLAFIV